MSSAGGTRQESPFRSAMRVILCASSSPKINSLLPPFATIARLSSVNSSSCKRAELRAEIDRDKIGLGYDKLNQKQTYTESWKDLQGRKLDIQEQKQMDKMKIDMIKVEIQKDDELSSKQTKLLELLTDQAIETDNELTKQQHLIK